MYDIVIRNGEVVTSGGAIGRVPLGVEGGAIRQIGGEMEGRREIDAAGKLVLPGGIDAHVHLTIPPIEDGEPFAWVDDFESGSAAALAGGITTLGNMSFPEAGETPRATLDRELAVAREQSIADFFLHPVLSEASEDVLADIPHLLKLGCNSIKIFMVTHTFDAQSEAYVRAIRLAGVEGLITLLHCEDYGLVEEATRRLVVAGHHSLDHYAESRPVTAEIAATQRAIAIAEETGAAVYIVHLSSARALDACLEAQMRGLAVYVETRPLYLHLTAERYGDADGAKYVAQPPIREQADGDALWAGLHQGAIHTFCTDHAPWLLADKLNVTHRLDNVRPGVANLQTSLPMLFSEGVRRGRISLRRFVEVTSSNAARLFGLYPRKGEIAVGSDADLVIFDPNLTRTVEGRMLKSRSDYSAFEGWEVTGWPVMTLRRGEVVFDGGDVLGQPGSGQYLRRLATSAL